MLSQKLLDRAQNLRQGLGASLRCSSSSRSESCEPHLGRRHSSAPPVEITATLAFFGPPANPTEPRSALPHRGFASWTRRPMCFTITV